MSPPSTPPRMLAGNLLVGLLLAVIAVGLLYLQPSDGTWLTISGHPHWWAAGIALSAWLAMCAGIVWKHRVPHPRENAGESWLIAWASQTGFARQLAEASAEALRANGHAARCMPLERITTATLAGARRALFIVSTTGEGDAPDHALAFLHGPMAHAEPLPQLRHAVLALGDHDYAQFCAFGRRLDAWLASRGATAMFERIDVDNAAPAAIERWQRQLERLGARTEAIEWEAPFAPWSLRERRELNPGARNGAVHALSLQPAEGRLPHWQAGDIAQIRPCNAIAAVDRWLADAAFDGNAPIGVEGVSTLREHLFHQQLPAADAWRGRPLPALLTALEPLPQREYSIASIPDGGTLDLLVRAVGAADGTPGLGSGWLCRHMAVGDTTDLRIRSNPGFHPPATDVPMILIGNGTGLAGLRAHLQARSAAGAHRNWLLFGERHAATDLYFADDIRAWQADGTLARFDFALSRDSGHRHHVQDALREAGDELRRWIADGAALYVCGILQGMAPGVDAVLDEVLGPGQREALLLDGRYRRDVY